MRPALRTAGLFLLVLEAACTGVKGTPASASAISQPLIVDASLLGSRSNRVDPAEPPGLATKAEAVIVTPLPPAVSPQPVQATPTVVVTEAVADVKTPAAVSEGPARTAPPMVRVPARTSTPVTAAVVVPAVAPVVLPPVTASAAKEPPLDVAALKARLRDTSAIGMFTKLALKNQVDDLLKMLRASHESHGTQSGSIASLRQSYYALVAKVLLLVEEGDPPLARTILGSREAIWTILADPEKFKAAT